MLKKGKKILLIFQFLTVIFPKIKIKISSISFHVKLLYIFFKNVIKYKCPVIRVCYIKNFFENYALRKMI